MATTAAIGLASMAIQPDVKPDLAFTNLIRDILPPGITGLVFGALLAAAGFLLLLGYARKYGSPILGD